MDTFYGFKLGQGQDFDDKGRRWPVTMVKAEPMWVVSPHQVAFGTAKRINKPVSGLLKSINEKITPRFIKEYKTEKNVGEKIIISDIFNAGDGIRVTGTMKGKGFAGVVKRHGFKGGPKTHGQSDRQRHPGAIGQTTTPGRVYKGKRMAGHMGNVQRTVVGLSVFAVKPEENLLMVRGLVPGPIGGLLKIKK
jgi:large subunit ribosomal protein L3